MAVPARTSKGDPREFLEQRVVRALVVFVVIAAMGTMGYYYLGGGDWKLWDCFYMTLITISTVGFAEVIPLEQVEGARAFTVILILLGSGTILYFASTITAFVVEGDLFGVLRRNRMQQRIDKLDQHIVVCGAGSTGTAVIGELIATRKDFVVIDNDEAKLEEADEQFGTVELLYVVGDATDDDILEKAGIKRAKGVVAALTNDKDNLFVTISARAENANARIVAKSVEASADDKMRRAGADAVVSPNRIGGLRLASEMVRPRVTQFLDLMLRDSNMRIEQISVPSDSGLVGMALNETTIRQKTDVLVIALKKRDDEFVINPSPDQRIETGMTLIVLASTDEMNRLHHYVDEGNFD